MQLKLLFFFLCLSISSFAQTNTTGFQVQSGLEKIKAQNYKAALENTSTFQYFIVIEVKNLNTGKTKAICTQGNFLQGAIHREYDMDYSKESIRKVQELLLANTQRYFEFKKEDALFNIGIDDYTVEEYIKFEKKLVKTNFLKRVKESSDWQITPRNDKEMKLYAHFLFEQGVLTGESSCFGGTLDKVIFRNNE